MFDALAKILGFIETAFEYFLNLIESLFMAIGFVASSIPFATALVPLLPSIIGTALIIGISIWVVKFIIGR